MKRCFILIITLVIAFSAYTKSYAQDDVADKIVMPFLNALKSGNTTEILKYIDGPLYKKNKELLSQNNNYADLLRTKYGKVEFLINHISTIDHDNLVADILFVFPDGNTVNRKLMLNKKEGSDSWKIVQDLRNGMQIDLSGR